MKEQILQRFSEYATRPGMHSQVAAAVLTLADVLSRPAPEPIVVEPDHQGTVGVKEAAELLHTSSKEVYQMCLAGRLRCYGAGGSIRIPIDEIRRFESEVPPSPALVPLSPR